MHADQFATESVKFKDDPLDIERAKAVALVGSVIVESAKVEVKALDVLGGGRSSGFLQIAQEPAK